MSVQTQVVSPERLQSALSHGEFVEKAREQFQEKIALHADEFTSIDAESADFLKSAAAAVDGPRTILLLGEDWCPDVHRTLAVVDQVSQASGLDLKVLVRGEETQDLTDRYPGRGDVSRIPTVLFLDTDGQVLAHWIERPQAAHDMIAAQGPPDRRDRTNRGSVMLDNRAEFREETVKEFRAALEARNG